MVDKLKTRTWTPQLRPGRNCSRVETAERVGVMVDTADYFRAFVQACEQAQYQILILGWDFDRHEDLFHGDNPTGLPSQLGDFLVALVKRKKHLRVFLLCWDTNMIYAPERELFPALRLRLQTPPRFHFRLDGRHPTGASQHQKVVVIDNRVAFCGGIDLTRRRWDTGEHLAADPRRIDPNGKPYSPFHDLMMVVEGPAAAALGELVRYRWRRSRGWRIRKNREPDRSPWPLSVPSLLQDVPVAMSRTFPAFGRHKTIREILHLHLDAIHAARQFIYIENQYFTAHALADAIATRLQQQNGPDVLLVLPEKTGGWLEQVTMDVLRGRVVKRLQQADKFSRLRVVYPFQPGLGNDCIAVHSKLLIVDDCLLRIGSANASNRSMGLDSECDLALESQTTGDKIHTAIRQIRHRLLAEHLGCEVEDVHRAEATHDRLLVATQSLMRDEGRSLRPLDCSIDPEVDELVPDSHLVDPEEPYNARYFREEYIPRKGLREGRMQLLGMSAIVIAMLVVAALWQWMPLNGLPGPEWPQRYLASLPGEVPQAAAAIAGVTLMSLLMVPLTLLALLAGAVFGGWKSFVFVLSGALISASLSYLLGRLSGQERLLKLGGKRMTHLSHRLASRGVVAVAISRLVPFAPFSLLNLMAGASPLRFRPYFVGSLLGLAPGIATLSLFSSSLWEAVRAPTTGNILLVLGTAALLIGFSAWTRKWLR